MDIPFDSPADSYTLGCNMPSRIGKIRFSDVCDGEASGNFYSRCTLHPLSQPLRFRCLLYYKYHVAIGIFIGACDVS